MYILKVHDWSIRTLEKLKKLGKAKMVGKRANEL